MSPLRSPLILLRGLARHQEHWGPFKSKILQNFEDVEFLDSAGNGSESHRASFLTIFAYTDDLRKRSRLIRHAHKPIILGISMGGMIATDWALRYPNEIAGIVLINVSFGVFSPPWKRLRPEAITYFRRIIIDHLEHDSVQREMDILRMVSNQTKEYKWEWASHFAPWPMTSFLNFLRQILASARYQGSVKKPKVPVLLLASQQDRMVDVSCSLKIQKFWRCPLELHPWAGHDLPFDDPEWVIELMVKHFGVPDK